MKKIYRKIAKMVIHYLHITDDLKIITNLRCRQNFHEFLFRDNIISYPSVNKYHYFLYFLNFFYYL